MATAISHYFVRIKVNFWRKDLLIENCAVRDLDLVHKPLSAKNLRSFGHRGRWPPLSAFLSKN